MKKVNGILGVVLVFLCGAAAGALLMNAKHHRDQEAMLAQGPLGMHKVIVDHLDKELSLSDAQRDQVQVIMQEHMLGMLGIMRPSRDKVTTLFETTSSRLRQVLDAAQLAQFETIDARRKQHLQMLFRKGMPGGQNASSPQ